MTLLMQMVQFVQSLNASMMVTVRGNKNNMINIFN